MASSPRPPRDPINASTNIPLPATGGHSPTAEPPSLTLETPEIRILNPPTEHMQPIPIHRGHSRSASNPFPSFFSDKKKVEQRGANDYFLDGTDDEDTHYPGASPSCSPQKRVVLGTNQEEIVTRTCMTCDHTNSLPRGMKGFRCGKCTTMNDLEPYYDKRSLRVPIGGGGSAGGPRSWTDQRPQRKVTLEQTRSIINQCISSYVRSELDEMRINQSSNNRTSTRRRGVSDSGHQRSHIPASTNDRDTNPPPALSPDSGSNPSGKPTGRNVSSDVKSAVPHSGSQTPSLPNIQVIPAYQNEPEALDARSNPNADAPIQWTGHGWDENRSGMDRPRTVFTPLENYIIASLDGCDVLNNSFLTTRSRYHRAASEGSHPSTNQVEDFQSPALADASVSQLDEKTILLGTTAENGSWWTGNRPIRHRSTNDYQNPKPGGIRTDLINQKSSRINWSEVTEWYQLIIHAGETWYEGLKEMDLGNIGEPANSMGAKTPEEVVFSQLNAVITESRLHVRRTLLKATERLLQRPQRPLNYPSDIRFLLILLENPLLHSSDLSIKNSSSSKSPAMKPNNPPRSGNLTSQNNNTLSAQRFRALSANKTNVSTEHRFLVLKRALGLLSNLPIECHRTLIPWFSRLSESHFQRLVETVSSFVTYRLNKPRKRRPSRLKSPSDNLDDYVPTFSSPGTVTPAQLHTALQREAAPKVDESDSKLASYSDDWQVRAAARVMALLFRANSASYDQRSDRHPTNENLQTPPDAHHHRHRIPISSFYNTRLDYADLVADFEAWESRCGEFSFCQYSFFLSIWAKIRILEHDARRQMEAQAREAFFDSILGRKGVSQYFVLKVRRDCLVEDSLSRVSEVVGSGRENAKKGLRIEFLGEEGVDAGGLRKEWFLLLVREVFDPNHGLFIYDEDSQYCYFNPYCFESSEQFFLVGVVLGLAIYNSTILDVALPPFAFRKLLSSAPPSNAPSLSSPPRSFRATLDDLAEYRPALAKGLRQLLEYDGDVEETFCYDFVLQAERYGETIQIPLCHDGENRPVTNTNRVEFVELYVRYILDRAVSRQFEPFKRGFFTVCGGNALYLFKPEEIELLVRGSEEPLDIPSLRAVAIYEHWSVAVPDREPVVNWFWDFFTRISPKDQRKVLSFITGSDRIPAMGAINLIIRLVCLGQDSERFPSARTCFNMVGLYRYVTRQKFESKLWRAVVESEGFGLK